MILSTSQENHKSSKFYEETRKIAIFCRFSVKNRGIVTFFDLRVEWFFVLNYEVNSFREGIS